MVTRSIPRESHHWLQPAECFLLQHSLFSQWNIDLNMHFNVMLSSGNKMFCVVTVSRTSQIPSTSLWATAYHSSLSEDSERHRLCSISQKYTITQSVSASMMIFLIVCICTYQGCVWCSFPLLGLILTSTHRVTSRPVVDWAPFTKELPNA